MKSSLGRRVRRSSIMRCAYSNKAAVALIDLLHVLLEGDAERQAHVGGNVGQPSPLALIEAEQEAE